VCWETSMHGSEGGTGREPLTYPTSYAKKKLRLRRNPFFRIRRAPAVVLHQKKTNKL